VDIVLLPQGEKSRPSKKPGCPRLETEQGKGFALSSGRITAAGGSGLAVATLKAKFLGKVQHRG